MRLLFPGAFMKAISDFLKKTLFKGRQGLSGIPGDSAPVNMTRLLLNPGKILIIPYKRMGTVLLATRVFKSLREHFSEAEIHVGVHEAWSVLIQRDPTIDQVITFGDYIESPGSKEFRDFGKSLKENGYDLAFFLSYQFDREIAALIRLSDAKLRIAFNENEAMDFFNLGIVPAPGDRYEVERYLELLRTLGIEGSVRDYTMTVTDTIREKARLRYLPSGSVASPGRIVGFDLTREIVGAPITKKNAETTIKTLITQLRSTVVVFYEPNKKNMAAELKEQFGKDIILVEDRPVSTLAGMLSLCRFVIAYNSDLLQLINALKTPVLGVLTQQERIRWTMDSFENFIHLDRQENSWPSPSSLITASKELIKKTKSDS